MAVSRGWLAAAALLAAAAAHAQAGDEAADDGGVDIEAGLAAVWQHASGRDTDTGRAQRRAGWRADVAVDAPLGGFAGAEVAAFAHLRAGGGSVLSLRPTFGASNALAFGDDDARAVLAQAGLRLAWQLAAERRFELVLGKVDPFGHFDQNAVADDETRGPLNSLFVHQPLLDAGGDVAVDRDGFARGALLAWDAAPWRASLGLLRAGGKPLTIGQLEAGGDAGRWRLYAWRRGDAETDDGRERRAGIGVSADLAIGETLAAFVRAGRRVQGEGGFEHALTLGADLSGRRWGRGDDGLGLAAGAACADGGCERVAELYYRWQVLPWLALTPDVQHVARPAGAGRSLTVVGLRLVASQ